MEELRQERQIFPDRKAHPAGLGHFPALRENMEITDLKHIRHVDHLNDLWAFIRLRPQLLETPENLEIMKSIGAKLAPWYLAAEHTVIIDLSQSEEQLLSNMRRQTRYEVRRADKLGIKVERGNSEKLFKEFHAVQAETAARQHFIPPDLKTLLAEREAFGKNANIYVAKTAEGEPIAYGLILVDGDEAEYYEAASTDLNRKLPGAYALQWKIIRDLKKQGVKYYNL